MHAPDWRKRYRNDLQKTLPRVPLAANFEAFRVAGRELMDLHAGYETCDEYHNVTLEVAEPDFDGAKGAFAWDSITDEQATELAAADNGAAFRIRRKMQWNRVKNTKTGKYVNDKTVLYVNNKCRLANIPEKADSYTVSGRSPLDWAIASLCYKKDKKSNISDNPNRWHAWDENPFELIRHLRRLIFLSVRSAEITANLPPSLDGPVGPDSPFTAHTPTTADAVS